VILPQYDIIPAHHPVYTLPWTSSLRRRRRDRTSFDCAGISGEKGLVFEKRSDVDASSAAYVVQAKKIAIPSSASNISEFIVANMHALKNLEGDDKLYVVRLRSLPTGQTLNSSTLFAPTCWHDSYTPDLWPPTLSDAQMETYHNPDPVPPAPLQLPPPPPAPPPIAVPPPDQRVLLRRLFRAFRDQQGRGAGGVYKQASPDIRHTER